MDRVQSNALNELFSANLRHVDDNHPHATLANLALHMPDQDERFKAAKALLDAGRSDATVPFQKLAFHAMLYMSTRSASVRVRGKASTYILKMGKRAGVLHDELVALLDNRAA